MITFNYNTNLELEFNGTGTYWAAIVYQLVVHNNTELDRGGFVYFKKA